MSVLGKLNLNVNGVALPSPADIGNSNVFVNKADLGEITPVVLDTTDNNAVADRAHKPFIEMVNKMLTETSTNNDNWVAADGAALSRVIGPEGTEYNEVAVLVQVAIIKASKTVSLTDSKFEKDDVAIVRFPIFITKPGGDADAARGGRRRTKMSKRHPTHRTRKHKK
jgi:hypothetical protein